MIQQNKPLHLIQVLRGVASLLVVLLHATINVNENFKTDFLGDFFSFGGAGVDIFFVLSGFIITYTSIKNLTHSDNVMPFLRRRIVRVFPTYWIIITGFLLLQVFFSSFYKTHYSFNIRNILSTYFLLPGHTMINGVSWTLTYELFFYFLFTLAFILPTKKLIYLVFTFYTVVLILLPVFGYYASNPNYWVNLLTHPMNTEFFMGILAALIIPYIPSKMCIPFVAGGCILFLVGGILGNRQFIVVNDIFNRVILFGIPAFFIIVGLVKFELHKSIEVHNIFLLLGEASYSLYLLHLPILVAFTRIIARSGITNSVEIHILLFVAIVMICFVSILFYKWIEKPIISKLNKLPKKQASVPVANEVQH